MGGPKSPQLDLLDPGPQVTGDDTVRLNMEPGMAAVIITSARVGREPDCGQWGEEEA